MPIEQLVYFAVWLLLALIGGALIVVAWERLRKRHSQSQSAGGKDA
jgi:hypothetical protein